MRYNPRPWLGFNPSRGIAIIQTELGMRYNQGAMFQSLTRDSNHSNPVETWRGKARNEQFQSLTRDSNHSNSGLGQPALDLHRFQSLTRDSNHSNLDTRRAIISSFLVSIPHAG